MAKTIGNLLDEVSDHFADQGLTPAEVGIWVERDGGPYQVTDFSFVGGNAEFAYVTVDEEDTDEDDLFTMSDLYKKLKKLSVKENTEIAAVCDDGDSDDDTPKPVKSFKFEDGQDEVKAAKVILVC